MSRSEVVLRPGRGEGRSKFSQSELHARNVESAYCSRGRGKGGGGAVGGTQRLFGKPASMRPALSSEPLISAVNLLACGLIHTTLTGPQQGVHTVYNSSYTETQQGVHTVYNSSYTDTL